MPFGKSDGLLNSWKLEIHVWCVYLEFLNISGEVAAHILKAYCCNLSPANTLKLT